MSIREVGSYIGYNRVTSTSQDSASGIWSLRAVERQMRAAAWPMPIVTDPNFASVSILLHFDGSNGSTTFTDSSNNAFSVTAVGNAQISTAASKFGGASLALDGNGDYLNLPSSAAFAMGTGDFTVECWLYTSYSAAAQMFVDTVQPGTSGGATSRLYIAVGTDQTIFVGPFPGFLQTTGKITLSSWNHVAVVRSGSTRTVYINGVSAGSGTFTDNLSSAYLTIGRDAASGGTIIWNGYIDDFRITKGVARYTANFTPPTAAFPDL